MRGSLSDHYKIDEASCELLPRQTNLDWAFAAC